MCSQMWIVLQIVIAVQKSHCGCLTRNNLLRDVRYYHSGNMPFLQTLRSEHRFVVAHSRERMHCCLQTPTVFEIVGDHHPFGDLVVENRFGDVLGPAASFARSSQIES